MRLNIHTLYIKFFFGLFLFSISIIYFAGCGGVMHEIEDIKRQTPIKIKENFGIFKFEKAISEIPKGKVIGGFYTGWGKILQVTYYAEGKIDESFQKIYEDVVISELINAGYNTISQKSLFEETIIDNARFLIGAASMDATLNEFSSVSDYSIEEMCDIRWEIFDRQEQKKVFNFRTKGNCESISEIEALRECVKISFRNFLANPKLITTLQEYIIAYPNSDKNYSTITKYSSINNRNDSTTNLEYINRCIFQIVGTKATGSGFIINKDGYGLTNNHVIKDNVSLKAIFSNGTSTNIKIISTDSEKDLALIKLNGNNFDFISLAKTNEIVVGTDVYAIGTPLGDFLSNTVSKGIVSGIRQSKNTYYIQTDASINPGNSGGPLIGAYGKVYGIITLKISDIGLEGLGFAISSEEAIKSFNLFEEN